MNSLVIPAEAKQSPAALLQWANDNEFDALDLRFTDIRGMVQHFSLPLTGVDEGLFEDGFGFDGSSVRGFQSIDQSDLILFPDLETGVIDPFFSHKTIAFLCDVYDPVEREPYSRDPRGVAKRAEAYLNESGIADTAFFGPELEFFLFSNVRYEVKEHKSYYEVDSHEGFWNTASAEPKLSYLNRIKEGYFPLPPLDKTQDVRADMVQLLIASGIDVEVHHHEVGGGGQAEIDLRYQPLLKMADTMKLYKYIIKNVAMQHGLIATFMPKPLFEENGSGMHVHQSLWKDGEPLFFGDKYASLSELALWYMGGVLKHAPAILAFTNPTTNSYRRLVPGYEAPVNLVYSNRNRSAAIRIPVYNNNPKGKRIETRFPDPAANAYFALPALLMAGLDGIRNQIDPGKPADYDLYEEANGAPTVPASLGAVLDALQDDHDFLLEGGVFTPDLIETYISYKRANEADTVAMRPHPYEFQLYLDN
ncbi:MAG: type I glutamate--ammonia ligase [Phototrophicales bacterium]|nr:MAG: type I glutamate--ammonia ligase [Phototrophicales bacterium]